jgi:hypothetical protein
MKVERLLDPSGQRGLHGQTSRYLEDSRLDGNASTTAKFFQWNRSLAEAPTSMIWRKNLAVC